MSAGLKRQRRVMVEVRVHNISSLHTPAPFFIILGLASSTKPKVEGKPLKTLSLPKQHGLMVSALNSGSSAPGSSPGREHCVVLLGKTLYFHRASLHPGV